MTAIATSALTADDIEAALPPDIQLDRSQLESLARVARELEIDPDKDSDLLIFLATVPEQEAPAHDTEPSIQVLNVDLPRLDGGTQPRLGTKIRNIKKILRAYRNGVKLPPPRLVFDGSNYWTPDGHHRIKAARYGGFTAIACVVQTGTQRDALRLAAKANTEHGEPRTEEDEWALVERWLTDPEFGRMSNQKIADEIGVTGKYVDKVNAALMLTRPQDLAPTRDIQRGASSFTRNATYDDNRNSADVKTIITSIPLPADLSASGWKLRQPANVSSPGYAMRRETQGKSQVTRSAAAPEEAFAIARGLAFAELPEVETTQLEPPRSRFVIVADPQRHPYDAPRMHFLACRGHIPGYVAVEDTAHRLVFYPESRVWIADTLASFEPVQHQLQALHNRLQAFVEAISRQPSYAARLAQLGGLEAAPNPLSPTTIRAIDPNRTTASEADWFDVDLPCSRMTVNRHTMVMVELASSSGPRWWNGRRHQVDQFVCMSDVEWSNVEAAYQELCYEQRQLRGLLRLLDNSQSGLARYDTQPAPAEDEVGGRLTPPSLRNGRPIEGGYSAPDSTYGSQNGASYAHQNGQHSGGYTEVAGYGNAMPDLDDPDVEEREVVDGATDESVGGYGSSLSGQGDSEPGQAVFWEANGIGGDEEPLPDNVRLEQMLQRAVTVPEIMARAILLMMALWHDDAASVTVAQTQALQLSPQQAVARLAKLIVEVHQQADDSVRARGLRMLYQLLERALSPEAV